MYCNLPNCKFYTLNIERHFYKKMVNVRVLQKVTIRKVNFFLDSISYFGQKTRKVKLFFNLECWK